MSRRSVFDRLNDPATFTGVYAERFRSGPGINHDADVRGYGAEDGAEADSRATRSAVDAALSPPARARHRRASSFDGYTNANTNERIRDIAAITRPYLNKSPRSVRPSSG